MTSTTNEIETQPRMTLEDVRERLKEKESIAIHDACVKLTRAFLYSTKKTFDYYESETEEYSLFR